MSADATNSNLSRHAIEKYFPRPKSERRGLALALSGGGYRAALFHLGALRRLNELGVLHQVTTLSSVSGGSVISGLLASRLSWPLSGPLSTEEWDRLISIPMRALASRNIRAIPFIKSWTLDWFKPGKGISALAAELEEVLTRMPLSKLPEHPKFIFCATDMACGTNWTFSKEAIGDRLLGFLPSGEWTLPAAVATSAAFPVIFGPMPIRALAGQFSEADLTEQEKDRVLRSLKLADGGNFDNLALEVVWATHETVLSSDGGDVFDVEPDSSLLRRVIRHIWILYNQSIDLRKRWLISNFGNHSFEGAYWGIGSAVSSYKKGSPLGYSKTLARKRISQIRTDFDVFSEAEIGVTENHGYVLADAAIRTHQEHLIRNEVGLRIPHEKWRIDEAVLDRTLSDSRHYRVLGRFR